jgi:chromosome partitioning protein
MTLKRNIVKLKDKYDYIIIDCPPSLGFLSLNALIACDSVIIPVQCEYFSMEAVAQVLVTISKVKERYNPELEIEGFLLTMFDSRTKLSFEVSSEVRSYFKEKTFTTCIPRNVSVSEATAKGLPLSLYKPNSFANVAYLSLAREIIDHEIENN